MSVALPKGFTVGVGAGDPVDELRGAPGLPHTAGRRTTAKDRTYSLRASVHNRALTFFGFSPEVSLIHEVRNTNAQLYDYKRHGRGAAGGKAVLALRLRAAGAALRSGRTERLRSASPVLSLSKGSGRTAPSCGNPYLS